MPELRGFSDLSRYAIIPKITVVSIREQFMGWNARRTMPEHQLILLTKGKGLVDIDAKEYLVTSGDLLYLPRGCTYWKLKPIDCNAIELVLVQFSYALLENANIEWNFDPVKNYSVMNNPDLSWHIHFDNNPLPFPFVQPVSNFEYIKSLFEKLLTLENHASIVYRWEQQYLLSQLIYEVIKNVYFYKNGHTINIISYTIEYIHKNHRENLRLADLMASCGINISTRRFISLFEQYTSFTPMSYLNHFRIERAKLLLTSSNARISSIAQEVGFKDEFYFSRMFKKQIGISPSNYRKAFSSSQD